MFPGCRTSPYWILRRFHLPSSAARVSSGSGRPARTWAEAMGRGPPPKQCCEGLFRQRQTRKNMGRGHGARAEVRRDSRHSMLLTDGDKTMKRDYPRVLHWELSEATHNFVQSSLIDAWRFRCVASRGNKVSQSFKREC
jgi:hypothetical protein